MSFQAGDLWRRALLRHIEGKLWEAKAKGDLKAWKKERRLLPLHTSDPQRLAMFDRDKPTRQSARLTRQILRQKAAKERAAVLVGRGAHRVTGEGKDARLWLIPKGERPMCAAKCRSGAPCRARVVVKPDGTFAARCRIHGGRSTGAKTAEGRERIKESNRTRSKATKYTPELMADILASIRRGSSVSRSCRAAGVSVQTFYNWQEQHPEAAQEYQSIGAARFWSGVIQQTEATERRVERAEKRRLKALA